MIIKAINETIAYSKKEKKKKKKTGYYLID